VGTTVLAALCGLATLGALAGAGCAARDEPGWVPLAGGTRSRSEGGAPEGLRIDPAGDAAWVDHALPSAAWRAEGADGIWVARRPDGVGFMKSGEQLALSTDSTSRANRADLDTLPDVARLEPGEFAAVGEQIHLRLAPGERPGAGRFSVRKERGRRERPALGAWTGDGFSLWPGEAMTFALARGARRELCFYWAIEGLAGDAPRRARLTLRVSGKELAVLEASADGGGAGGWNRIPLPDVAGAEPLAFELGGEPCLAVVLAPGTARVDAPEPARPDLVLFLADTFRADNLAAWGGEPGLAPELDRLADEGLAFVQARSPSTWTLPAQASLLSALFPEQHGAVSLGHGLPDELVTLGEWLARHGYRTGAVTDSAFVSRNYGLDQGFEWFQEFRRWDLRATLRAAREFLAADDGRPAFLFVQTYRTHMPYRTGAEEERQALEEVVRAVRAGCARYGGDGSMSSEEAGARMLAVYREGARALDAQFGPWWRALQAERGERLYLAFTSDHGEAFLEHDEAGHGGMPWEEKIRVPLFLAGPGLPRARVDHGASLVDLPATLCALAGLPAHAGWEGTDLTRLAGERRGYSFVRIGAEPLVAVLDGPRKLFASADPVRLRAGEVRGAMDLSRDPGERTNLAELEAWPADLARAEAGTIERLLRLLAEAERVELSREDRAHLDALGYGGE
jgi:arylsulfatase